MAGIDLASGFNRTSASPLDLYDSVADITARNAIASGVRYKGMMVYVASDTKTYQLKSGITNADWKSIGGGGGGFAVVKTANYTVTIDDSAILGNCTSGNLTFTLPTAAAGFADQKAFIFLKTDSSANTLTIQANGAELINGANTQVIYDQYNVVLTLISDGTAWYLI